VFVDQSFYHEEPLWLRASPPPPFAPPPPTSFSAAAEASFGALLKRGVLWQEAGGGGGGSSGSSAGGSGGVSMKRVRLVVCRGALAVAHEERFAVGGVSPRPNRKSSSGGMGSGGTGSGGTGSNGSVAAAALETSGDEEEEEEEEAAAPSLEAAGASPMDAEAANLGNSALAAPDRRGASRNGPRRAASSVGLLQGCEVWAELGAGDRWCAQDVTALEGNRDGSSPNGQNLGSSSNYNRSSSSHGSSGGSNGSGGVLLLTVRSGRYGLVSRRRLRCDARVALEEWLWALRHSDLGRGLPTGKRAVLSLCGFTSPLCYVMRPRRKKCKCTL
jgi:hypothetical protein